MGAAITLEQIINFLLEAPMFGDLDPTELSEVVHIMQVQRLREGQYVFRQGDTGDAWYVLYEGEAEVIKETDSGSEAIALLHKAACFGEMAVLDGSSRSATIRTTKATTAFRFPRVEFKGLLENGNLSAYKLVYQMALVLAARQRSITSRLAGMLRMEVASSSDYRQGLEPILEETTRSE